MGFLQPGIPLEEEKRRRAGIARAFAGFFQSSRKEPPDVSTDRGAGFKPRPEMWQYPLRKDGTRREGTYFRPTPRDKLGRFAERFDVDKFKKKHPLWFKDKKDPVTRK